VAAANSAALAQQTTGTPGSPSATTTIPGTQLPAPPPKFGGVINESTTQSTPYWPPRLVPPKGAPNVLLIMTDDQGYGVSSTFGGVIPTPTLDRIAANGLRYTLGPAFRQPWLEIGSSVRRSTIRRFACGIGDLVQSN
jgi:arylsulfatase